MIQQAATTIRRWREDPLSFVRECLRVEPDAWQVRFINAFRQNQRLALKACKGPGKTAVLSWLGWNFLATRPNPNVICTSITGENLRDGMWKEFALWQQRSDFLREHFTWSAERIVYNRYPETWFASARKWSQGADPNQQANTLAGIHAEYVLFLIDEAGGIPDGVVAAAEGGLSTGIETKMLMAGNPTHLSGPLWRACEAEREYWYVQEISGDPDDPERSPRIDIEWARKEIKTRGRNHDWVKINVLGQFPSGQANSLIALGDARAATQRGISEDEYRHYPRILGVDVAYSQAGDQTVYTIRQGRVVYRQRTKRDKDTMKTAREVAEIIRKWKVKATFVDRTGVGAGVVDRLLELGYQVTGVDSASTPPRNEYKNMRAYMWGMMAEWIKGEVCIPEDDELAKEMAAPTFRVTPDNKILVESKADMKKRGVASPDKADSLALTFAAPVPMEDPEEEFYKNFPGAQRDGWDYDPFARSA